MKEEGNIKLGKRIDYFSWVLTVIVLALVGMMRRPQFKIHTDIDFSFLPPVHSAFNACAAISLLFALYFIKNKNVQAHQKAIYAALSFSALFLISYVIYHFTSAEVKFGDVNFDGIVDEVEKGKVGISRTIYLIILATHVALAGAILPFILMTFGRAYSGQYEKHKKMARYVFPLWLYVTITGPICYLMLRPYY